jgi:hypothetical protein
MEYTNEIYIKRINKKKKIIYIYELILQRYKYIYIWYYYCFPLVCLETSYILFITWLNLVDYDKKYYNS